MTSPELGAPHGTSVLADYRKWDGSAHWRSRGVLLGTDEHGTWVGFGVGTHFARPGAAFDLDYDSVSLFPAAGYTPAFNAVVHPERVAVYVDTTTRPVWSCEQDGLRVTMTDLDLDVVQRRNGFLYVDDEDEFVEHRRRFGYPPEVVAQAETDTRAVFAAVRDGRAPFDGTGERWLRRLRTGR